MSYQPKPFIIPSDRVDRIDVRHENVGPITVATTGNSDLLWIVPRSVKVEGIKVVGTATLTANDTNYITWTVTNLGTAGSGSTALLSTADTNTTKATGGSTLTTLVPRSLVLTSTDTDLKATEGDVIRIRAAATGTLANTVTGYNVFFKVSENLIK
jgi:hypothetical protein